MVDERMMFTAIATIRLKEKKKRANPGLVKTLLKWNLLTMADDSHAAYWLCRIGKNANYDNVSASD